jgi:hypothetical protein
MDIWEPGGNDGVVSRRRVSEREADDNGRGRRYDVLQHGTGIGAAGWWWLSHQYPGPDQYDAAYDTSDHTGNLYPH